MSQSLEIRSYRRADRHELWRLLVDTSANWESSARRLDEQLTAVEERGGRIWLLWLEARLVGYALVDPLPGLEGIFDLQGYVKQGFRRQGLATNLLEGLVSEMGNSNRALITHAVDSLNSAAACFLLNRGFFIEHEEVKLRYEDLDDMIPDLLPPGFETMTLPMPGTATTFRHLYDLSFGDTPWHQPYLSDEEVLQELEDADDLHYLTHNHRPVGFAWLRWPSLKEAEVEPLGIIPDYQQRGLGRLFLEQVMDQAERQGAESVQISAWKQNEAALALYRRIGFHLYATTTYLGYQIKGKSQISQ